MKLIHKNGFVANDLRPENISFAAKSNNVILMIDFSKCTPIREPSNSPRDLKQYPTVKDDLVSLFHIFVYMLNRDFLRSVVKNFDLKNLGVEQLCLKMIKESEILQMPKNVKAGKYRTKLEEHYLNLYNSFVKFASHIEH